MKRGTVGLVKFRLLCTDLDLPQYAAEGLLVALWRVTAENAPAGDIGRFTDEEVAAVLDWRGDPAALIRALVKRGWLDEHPVHRLVVHDWPQHCEAFIHYRLIEDGRTFADGTAPRLGMLRGTYHARAKAIIEARAGNVLDKDQRNLQVTNSEGTEARTSNLPVTNSEVTEEGTDKLPVSLRVSNAYAYANANAILDPGSSPTCKLSLERSGGVLRGGACAPPPPAGQSGQLQETPEMPQDAPEGSDSMETPPGPRSRRAGQPRPICEGASGQVDAVVAAWNGAAAKNGHSEGFGLCACRVLSSGRRRHLLARLSEPGWAAAWREALDRAARSSFVAGHNDRGWRGNLDWFLRPDTVARILEGRFDDAAAEAGF